MSSLYDAVNAYVYEIDLKENMMLDKYAEAIAILHEYTEQSSVIYSSTPFLERTCPMHKTLQSTFVKYFSDIAGHPVKIHRAVEIGMNTRNLEFPGYTFHTYWSIRTSPEEKVEDDLVSCPNFVHSDTRTFFVTTYSVPINSTSKPSTFSLNNLTRRHCIPRFKFELIV